MTEENTQAPQKAVPEQGSDSAAPPPKDPVRRWTFILLVLIALFLAVYLRADRITPVTSQARVHALVVPIAPEVSGTVTGVFVANNQPVTADQELFQIDIERYRLAVQNAEAALDQARQAQGAAQANVDAARASLDSALASEERARLDAQRQRTIREQDPGAISARRLESAEASLASAEARVTSARAALQASIENLGKPGDQNAAVQQALAALATARLNLERATVTAPADGVVTGVQLDRGNFAAAGAPQMTFIATKDVWVQAEFTENNLGHLDRGDEVELVFDVFPGRVLRGAVREVGFGVSVDSPPLGALPTIQNDKNWLRNAQRYPVLVDFDPLSEEDRRRLKVGSQATVVVYTGRHPVFNLLARFYMRALSILSYAY